MDNRIFELSKKYERKRMLKRVVSLLCVIVLLFTMNTLKRNANTLERIPMCGLEEHIHDSACYNEAGELVCGRQEHVHTDACYQESPKKKGKSGDLDVNIDGFDNTGNLIDSGDVQSLDLSSDLDQQGLLDFVQDSNGGQGSDNVMEKIDGGLLSDVPKENAQESPAGVANNAAETQEVHFEFAGEAQGNAAQTSAIADAQQPAADAGQPVTDDEKEEEEPAVVGQPVDDEKKEEEPAVAGQPVDDEQKEEEPAVAGQPADDEQREEEPAVVGQPVDDEKKEEEPAVAGQPVDDEQREEEPAVVGQPVDDEQKEEEPAVAGQPVDDEQEEASAVGEQSTDDEVSDDEKEGEGTSSGADAPPSPEGKAFGEQPADGEQKEELAVDGQLVEDDQKEEEPADGEQKEELAVDGQLVEDDQKEEEPADGGQKEELAVDGQLVDGDQHEEEPAVGEQSTDDEVSDDEKEGEGTSSGADAPPSPEGKAFGEQPADGEQKEELAVDGQLVEDDQKEEQPADGEQKEELAVDGQLVEDDQKEEEPADGEQKEELAVDGQLVEDDQKEEEPAVGEQPTDDEVSDDEKESEGTSSGADAPPSPEGKAFGEQPMDDNQQEEAPAVGEQIADNDQKEEEPAVGEQPAEGDQKEEEPVVGEQPAEGDQKEEEPAVGEQPADGDQKEEEPAVGEQPADGDQKEEEPAVGEQPADGDQKEEEPAVGEQPADGEQKEEEPAVGDGESEADGEPEADGEQEADGEPEADGEQEADGEPKADGEQEADGESNADGEAEADGEIDADGEQEAESVGRRYTATVDLAETKTYPISLRGMIANAVPAEGDEPAADEADEESAPEDAAEKPVDEWSIEFDSGLFAVETAEDDILITPQADFDSAEIILSNGSLYELTLINCTLEQPEDAATAETEPEIARPAQHFEQATDYISVVVDAPEGAFPDGTVMVVRDVVDQETIDNIEQSVTEDFVEVKSVHAVDISFWYNDVEIEPSLPISVLMSAVEVEKQQQTQDAVVVHVTDDGDAQVVDSETTGTAEASLEMPAGESAAQSFEADTFSVYALVMTERIETKYIDDSGETWSIKVGFTKDAKIPTGATLVVSEVTDESYLTEAEAALESGKRITKARFFDIRIMDGDREVQPEDKVQVTVNLVGDEGTVEPDPEATEVGDPEVCAMHFVEKNDEVVKVETQNATETKEGVTFNAEGFSVWGVVYTVDFEYNGIRWSFPGRGSYAIADIMAQIGVEGEVESVELERTVDVGGPANALFLSDDHTALVSEEAFQDTFELTVVVEGKTYVITVTDAAGDEGHTLIINVVSKPEGFSGHVYVVLMQDGISTPQGDKKTHYFLKEINLNDIGSETDYAKPFSIEYNGISDSQYDTTKPTVANGAISAYGTSNALNMNTLIYSPNGVQYIDEINGKSIDISTDNATHTTTVTIGAVYDYTASISFVDQTGNNTTPDLTNYKLVGTVENDTYEAVLAGNTLDNLTFTKNGETFSDPLPEISSWFIKDGSDADVTRIDGFEFSSPIAPAKENTTTLGVKNYKFTATKYANCGISFVVPESLNTYNFSNYYVLFKQDYQLKYFAQLSNPATIKDASFSTVDGIRGTSGYSFEIVYCNGEVNNVDALNNGQPKYNDGSNITINEAPYIFIFPTEATGTSNNLNYVFTVSEPPQYKATFSFMEEGGENAVTETGLSGSYYVLIKAGNDYALSSTPVDLSAPTSTVVFNDFYSYNNSTVSAPFSKRYTNASVQTEIRLVRYRDTTNSAAPYIATVIANNNGTEEIESITLSGEKSLAGYTISIDNTTNGAVWNGTFTKAPKYNANIRFVDSAGNAITPPDIAKTYYYLVSATVGSEKWALSETPVDFTGTNRAVFDMFYESNGSNGVSAAYDGHTLQSVYLVSKNQDGHKPTIVEATEGSNGVEKIPITYGTPTIFEGIYALTGAASGASYTITAKKLPAYSVVSSFVDSNDKPIAKALNNSYYLVVKTNIGSYIDTYDPARNYNITTFYDNPTLDGGDALNAQTNEPTAKAYSGSTTVSDVYLVEKSAVTTAEDALTAAAPVKITTGPVEIYSTFGRAITDEEAVLTFKKTANSENFTTTIMFFDENAEVIEAAGDVGMHVNAAESNEIAPSLTKHYYVLAKLVERSNESKIVGWAIHPVSLDHNKETSTLFSQFIPFGDDGSTTTGTPIQYSDVDLSTYKVVTRLYRTDTAHDDLTYYTLVTNKTDATATDEPERGYEFVGNWNPTPDLNEIHLKAAAEKTYAVRVRFKASDFSKLKNHEIGADKKIYVNVIVTHATDVYSYQNQLIDFSDFASLEVDDEGYPYIDCTFDTDSSGTRWKDPNGDPKTGSNLYFTGNESDIKVEIVQVPQNVTVEKYQLSTYNDAAKYQEGESILGLGYMVHYDTRWTTPQATVSKFHEAETTGNVIQCYDVIDLILRDADSEYDYATILGPNYSYGIVADHLFQNNDLQTNFAVNHYTGHGDFVTPDLSNTPGAIVIGEFNRNSDVMAENHVGRVVGINDTADGEDVKAGTLRIGSNVENMNSLVIYVDDNSGVHLYNTYGIDGGNPVQDERNKVYVSMQDGAYLQSSIVNPGIRYGESMSRTLAAKSATYTPTYVDSDRKPVVDTTGFPDGATIYIDADAMLKADGGAHDDIDGTLYVLQNLKINKKDNQLLVFNFKNTRNVRINQFSVHQENLYTMTGTTPMGPDQYFSTNTSTNHSDTNAMMDQLSQHIVWNFASCTGRVELDTVGGICLQPNYGSETQVSGTSGGWLVSSGYVYNNNSEWHNFFSHVPENTKVELNVLKTVDGKVPSETQTVVEKFNFTLYEYDANASPDKWKPLGNTVQNNRSSVQFVVEDPADTQEADRKLTVGWHVYKIVEQQEKPAENTTDNKYIFDTTEYYAAVRVTTMGSGENETRIVSAPLYYKNFSEEAYAAANKATATKPEAIGLSNFVASVIFENEVKKAGLTLKKTVTGTDSGKASFTFLIKAWTGTSPTAALTNNSYDVTGLAGMSSIGFTHKTEGADSWSECTLELKNGQSATIALPENTRYTITETHVNGKAFTYSGTVEAKDGYTPQTVVPADNKVDGDGSKVDFVNNYAAEGNVTLKVHKELKGGMVLPADAFGFVLYQVGVTKQVDENDPKYAGTDSRTFPEYPYVVYNDDNGEVTFPEIEYTEADMEGATLNPITGKRMKIISYRVHEIDGGLADFDYTQVINDSDKMLTVILVDEGDGEITTTAYPGDFCFRFNNQKGVEVVLEGYKKLIGRDMKGGEVFRFEARENVSTTSTEDWQTVSTAILTGARDGEKTKFTFKPIKYTVEEMGENTSVTHTYEIREVLGSASDLTYSTKTYKAIVTVTKDTETNKLTVSEPIYKDGDEEITGDQVFTNICNESIAAEKFWSNGNENHPEDCVQVKLYVVYGNAVDPQPGSDYKGKESVSTDPLNSGEIPSGVTGHDIAAPDDRPTGAVPVETSTRILNKENGWKYTWRELPAIMKDTTDNIWKHVTAYYVVETWSSAEVTGTSYATTANNGRVYRVEITNTTIPGPGALKLKKVVTIDGEAADGSNKADGWYIFSIVGPSPANTVTRYLGIYVGGGVATNYCWTDDSAAAGWGKDDWERWWGYDLPNGYWGYLVGNDPVPDAPWVRFDDLPAGDYTITELLPAFNGATLTTVARGDGYSDSINNTTHSQTNIVDVLNHKVVVSVASGNNQPGDSSAAAATFTNNKNEGFLKLKKVVTVQGNKPDEVDEYELVDGAYLFSITPSGESDPLKYVWIIVERGEMTKYAIHTGRNYWENDSGWWRTPRDGWALIDEQSPLDQGVYVVKEEGHGYQYTTGNDGKVIIDENKPLGSVTFAGITGGTVSGNQTTVTAGGDALPVEVAFTNNGEFGSLAFKKAVEAYDGEAIGARADGTYEFLVEGPGFLRYIEITITNGLMSAAKEWDFDNNEYVTITSENIAFDPNTGVTISKLIQGEYTIEECGSYPAQLPSGTKMILRDIAVSPSVGNSVDIVAGKAMVNVTNDATPSVTVTFTNAVEKDTTDITVKKVWRDENGDEVDAPDWITGLDHIVVSAHQKRDGNQSGHHEFKRIIFSKGTGVTTDIVTSDGNLKLNATGKRLRVEPEEPGSINYKIVSVQEGGDPWQIAIVGFEKKTHNSENVGNPGSNYYKIEEVSVEDASGGKLGGYELSYGLSPADGGGLTTVNGVNVGFENINDDSIAIIYNQQPDDVALALRKVVEASTDGNANGQLAALAGTYNFTVVGPASAADAEKKVYSVSITMDTSGQMTSGTATVKTGVDTAGDGTTANNAEFNAQKGVILSGLTPGVYTLKEENWTATGTLPEGTGIYLKDICTVPSDRLQTKDYIDRTATVMVGAGETSTLEAVFKNILEPNTPTIDKLICDFNDSEDIPDHIFGAERPEQKSADYDIGDQIPYRVTATLASGYYRSQPTYYFEIEDVMQRLQYVGSSGDLSWSDGQLLNQARVYAFVKSDSEGQTGSWYDVSNYFHVEAGSYSDTDHAQTIKVYPKAGTKNLRSVTSGRRVTNWGKAGTHGDRRPFLPPTLDAETDIVNADIRYLQFRYWATLKDDARIGPAEGNPNTVYLDYQNRDTNTQRPSDTNIVYTYKLVVNKQKANGDTLEGATFQLFKKYKQAPAGAEALSAATGEIVLHGLTDGVTVDTTQTVTYYSPIAGDYYLVPERPARTQSSDPTQFVWEGIDDGWYILVETQAPDHYVRMVEPLVLYIKTELVNAKPGFTSGTVIAYPSSMQGNIVSSGMVTSGTGIIEANIPNSPYPGITIQKIDEETRGKTGGPTVLEGAEFTLNKWNDSLRDYSAYTPQSLDGQGNQSATATTNANGIATYAVVEPGEYKLVESGVPGGYIRAVNNTIYFKVTYDAAGKQHITRYSGPLTVDSETNTVNERTQSEEVSVSAESGPATFFVTYAMTGTNESVVFTVGNHPGAKLPATGGPGTTLYYAAGAGLLLLAALGLALTHRRRREGEGIR